MTQLHEGDAAPNFSSLPQSGGKWILLYFYPMDDTPGCTVEACAFRDHFEALNKKLTILGVSGDSSESHEKFKQKYNLPFDLLADPDRTLINAYGADGMIFSKRTSFLVDPTGIIRKVYASVKPEEHAVEVLRDLEYLQRTHSPGNN